MSDISKLMSALRTANTLVLFKIASLDYTEETLIAEATKTKNVLDRNLFLPLSQVADLLNQTLIDLNHLDSVSMFEPNK